MSPSTVDRTRVPSLLRATAHRPRRLRASGSAAACARGACLRALLIISAFGNLERGALALPARRRYRFSDYRQSRPRSGCEAAYLYNLGILTKRHVTAFNRIK